MRTNNDTESYWVTETGEWGSNDVETVEFTGHHEDIHQAFEMVNDYQLPDWAVFLARHPHELDLNNYNVCQACEDLAEVFNR